MSDRVRRPLDRRAFKLLYDPAHPKRVSCHVDAINARFFKDVTSGTAVTQTMAMMRVNKMAREMLKLWAGSKLAPLARAVELASFFETGRVKNFPACKRQSVMRAFQDDVTVLQPLGLVQAGHLDDHDVFIPKMFVPRIKVA